jgi:hypothetical protein
MAGLRDVMALRRRWQPVGAVMRRWLPASGAMRHEWQAGVHTGRRAGALVRGHWLISVAVVLSLVPRVLAALAFRPALFIPDSFSYLTESAHPVPGQWHPAGYAIMLWVLRPFHSLLLVTTLQHLLGVATAVLVYAVLRRWGLPAWGAVLAAGPTLFDTRQINVESFILPDEMYAFLITLAVAVLLLTRRKPAPVMCALAGLLLAGAAVMRGNGAPEMVAVVAVLLLQRVGWRAVTAAVLAFAIPVLGYMGLFAARHGDFALTNSDGMFLWSRTMSFANCAVIKPPMNMRPLCPDQQPIRPIGPTPAWSVSSLLSERLPSDYLWNTSVWWRYDAHPGFNAANNKLAMSFALKAIRAQPGSYLRTVGSGLLFAFVTSDRSLAFRSLRFTPVPQIVVLSPRQLKHLRAYGHVGSNTHPVQPYAYFLYLYQEPVFFPGFVLLLLIVTGLTGVIMRWRQRGGPVALPWLVAVVGVVFPIAVHEYRYRYVIAVVPLVCLAAGLAFARRSDPASLGGQLAELESGGDTPRGHQVAKPAPDGTQADVELPGDRLVLESSGQ